jgi:hypothetical protein
MATKNQKRTTNKKSLERLEKVGQTFVDAFCVHELAVYHRAITE